VKASVTDTPLTILAGGISERLWACDGTALQVFEGTPTWPLEGPPLGWEQNLRECARWNFFLPVSPSPASSDGNYYSIRLGSLRIHLKPRDTSVLLLLRAIERIIIPDFCGE